MGLLTKRATTAADLQQDFDSKLRPALEKRAAIEARALRHHAEAAELAAQRKRDPHEGQLPADIQDAYAEAGRELERAYTAGRRATVEGFRTLFAELAMREDAALRAICALALERRALNEAAAHCHQQIPHSPLAAALPDPEAIALALDVERKRTAAA